MTEKSTKKHVVSYKTLNDVPKPKPLSNRLKAKTEKDIVAAMSTDPDVGAIPPNFWKDAKLVMPSEKISVGIRLDRDVVEWFKTAGKGYQSRMNAVLKSYMDAHIKTE